MKGPTLPQNYEIRLCNAQGVLMQRPTRVRCSRYEAEVRARAMFLTAKLQGLNLQVTVAPVQPLHDVATLN